MKRATLLLTLCMACKLTVNGQAVENTLKKISSLHNISYTEVLKDKMSFDDAPYVDTIKAQVRVVHSEKQNGGYYKLKRDSDIDLYDGDKSIWLNLRDSTYKIDKDAITGQATRTLLYWYTEMKSWQKNIFKIKQLNDRGG